MKTIATLALLGLVAASEDNELFVVHHNKTSHELFVHHNRTHTASARPHPVPISVSHKNATVQAKPHRPVHPVLFNRTNPKTKEWLNAKGPKALTKILSSYDDDELWNIDNIEADDDELMVNNYFSKVGNFVGKNKSAVLPLATKLFGHFDDATDSELASVMSMISKGTGKVGSVLGKLAGNLDDELTADELAFLGSFTRVVQKATSNTVGKKAVPFIALDDASEQELFNLDAFLNDAVRTYNDARQTQRNYGNLVNDGIQLIKDIKQKKDDEELFNLGDLINDGINVYEDVKTHNYQGIVNHGIQIVKDIKRKDDEEDDEELFKFDILLNDAIKTYNDARQNPRNYGALVNDGIQIVKDLKAKKSDDEELFNLGGLINDGMSIYKDVKNKNYGGLVNDSIQTVKDVKKNLRHH